MRATPDFDFQLGESAEMIRESVGRFADEQIQPLAEKVDQAETQRSEDLTNEVRMLEDLVHRMGQDLEARLAGISHAPVHTHEGRRTRQHAALLETVRAQPFGRNF